MHNPAAPVDIKSISEAEFERLYGTSRFTCGVLANRCHYIAEHMCTDLVHRAFSPIISFSHDFVGAVIGAPDMGYPLVGVNKGNAAFFGSISNGVRDAVEEYGIERLGPGDLLICNDPYRVGNHVNDMCFIRPVFHGGRIVAFAVVRAHQLDMGGTVAGGFSLLKMNSYENGLVMPPILIFQGDKPVRETIKILLDNTRFGEILLPDFYTIRSSCALGDQLLQESLDRYGEEVFRGAMRYNLDASADSMRRAIATLPDGDYEGEDTLDCDGIDPDTELKLHVKVIKRGDRVEVDLSGTSPQACTSLNATEYDAQTAVVVALKMLLDPTAPFTSGINRPVDVVIPIGTVTSARPDASIMFYHEVSSSLINAVVAALAKPLGSRAVGGSYGSANLHTGQGANPDGSPWFSAAELEAQFGGWGATDAGDADSHSGLFILNQRVTPTEEIELRAPVLLMSKEYVTDTGGPGTHRGGASLRKEGLFLSDGDHYVYPLHFRRPSGWGVHGGSDGRVGGAWFYENDDPAIGEDRYRVPAVDDFSGSTPISGVVDEEGRLDAKGTFAFFGSRRLWTVNRGSTLRWITNGGGGWGDPFARDANAVLSDVRNGYVSVEGALRDYGVVVLGDPDEYPEQISVDEAATRQARAKGR
ncbi:MAG: hydantoinase B/oxoprolinase family protein [Sphingobium sp.]